MMRPCLNPWALTHLVTTTMCGVRWPFTRGAVTLEAARQTTKALCEQIEGHPLRRRLPQEFALCAECQPPVRWFLPLSAISGQQGNLSTAGQSGHVGSRWINPRKRELIMGVPSTKACGIMLAKL